MVKKLTMSLILKLCNLQICAIFREIPLIFTYPIIGFLRHLSAFVSLSLSLSLSYTHTHTHTRTHTYTHSQISYTATSITLSDTERFPNFFRTISSDNSSIAAFSATIEEYGWEQVAIITQINELFSNVSVKP